VWRGRGGGNESRAASRQGGLRAFRVAGRHLQSAAARKAVNRETNRRAPVSDIGDPPRANRGSSARNATGAHPNTAPVSLLSGYLNNGVKRKEALPSVLALQRIPVHFPLE